MSSNQTSAAFYANSNGVKNVGVFILKIENKQGLRNVQPGLKAGSRISHRGEMRHRLTQIDADMFAQEALRQASPNAQSAGPVPFWSELRLMFLCGLTRRLCGGSACPVELRSTIQLGWPNSFGSVALVPR